MNRLQKFTKLTKDQLEILNRILEVGFNSWSPDLKDTLRKLTMIYLTSDQVEGNAGERITIAFHLQVFNDLITDIQSLYDSIIPPEKEPCIDCLKKEGVIQYLQKELSSLQENIQPDGQGENKISNLRVV